MKKIQLILICTLTLGLMAACVPRKTTGGVSVNGAKADSGAPESETTYPVTIAHAFGKTVIDRKPERIVAFSWGNQDVPLALGIVPVGISKANYGVLDGSGILPWTAKKLAELGGSPIVFNDTDGLDFEAINEAAPDVILAASSGMTQDEYDMLSAIAPVIAYPGKPWQTLWREQILLDAAGMGMEAEGKQLVSDLESRIAQALRAYPQLAGKTAAFMYFDPANLSTLSGYSPSDPRCAFLEDLGLTIPDSIRKLAAETDSFYFTISAENADLVSDADIILTWASGDGSGMLEALQNDPLIGAIPAIKRGSVVLFAEGPLAAAQTPSALSIPWSIDEYLGRIAEAAEKVK